jgi:hypothetical protein
MATALGNALQKIPSEKEQMNVIRKTTGNIRFESDESGYYYPVPKVLNIFLAIHFLHKNPCFEPIFFI